MPMLLQSTTLAPTSVMYFRGTQELAFIVGLLVCMNSLVAQTDTGSWGFNDIPEDSQVNQMSGPRFGFTYLSDGSGHSL